MNQLPSPSINVFERLQATDGLLINAERWRRTHEYHRQRQNLHYQSLNQPGIVCGLGVCLIPAPKEIQPQYRDDRWLEIQPGIAIDLVGNPIVIPQPMQFRIASEPSTQVPLTVYLVVSHVDPEKLHRKDSRDFVQETFRVDEKASLPGELEVELCRIHLQPGVVELKHPVDVFFPGDNTLDLRYRLQAQARPQATVRVAQVTHNDENDEHVLENLAYLLRSITGLYPALQGAVEPGQVNLQLETVRENGINYDLLYLTRQRFLSLKEPEADALKKYIETGGVLLLEASTNGASIDVIGAVRQELQEALAQQFGTQMEELSRNHPLRTQPFLFAALPCLKDHSIQLFVGGGIILIIGDLSFAWGLNEDLTLSRSMIRAAQEIGINILHFAWRRQQLTQLLQKSANTVIQKLSESAFSKLVE